MAIDSFSVTHQLYLIQLDKAYERVRDLTARLDVINPDWPEYKKAVENFNELRADIFRLKEAWELARRLEEESGNSGD